MQLFGAGREKRIYAIPPYTSVVSLDFDDHPFERYRFDGTCALCGADDSYLDEVITDDRGGRMFVCSDTDYCARPPRRCSPTRREQERSPWLTTPSIRMRPATEADLPAVLALYAQPDLDNGHVLPVDEARRILKRFADYPDYTLYVAERGDAVVGSWRCW